MEDQPREFDLERPRSALMRLVARRHNRRVDAGTSRGKVESVDPGDEAPRVPVESEDPEMKDAWESMWHRFDVLAPLLYKEDAHHRRLMAEISKVKTEEDVQKEATLA